MLLGIIVNILAAISAGLATVLLRRVATEVEKPDDAKLLPILIRRPLWWVGIAALLGNFVGTYFAFRLAPVPVVQPFAAVSLIAVVVFAIPLLGERPNKAEFIGIIAVVVGLFVSLATIGDDAGLKEISPVVFIAVVGGLLVYCVVAYIIFRRGVIKGDSARGALVGTVTGTAMGVGAAMLALLGAARNGDPGSWIPPTGLIIFAIVLMLIAGAWGIGRLQHALRELPANYVAPTHQITLLLVPIVVAVTVYGQTLPGGFTQWTMRIVALVLVVGGIYILSTAKQVAEDMEVLEAGGGHGGIHPVPPQGHAEPVETQVEAAAPAPDADPASSTRTT
ncbi:MAG: EamA family transporter [Actinobacteria bacterium]|nr:EamA family transporter [Actinomycetota bacterium]